MMKRITSILLLLLYVVFELSAQQNVVREHTGPSSIQFEHHFITHDTSVSIIIPFRARYDFFVFTRTFENGTEIFTARGEVSIELIDSAGTSAARSIQEIKLTSADNTPQTLRDQFMQNVFTLDVPRGKYTIVLNIEDKESNRLFVDDKQRIVIPSNEAILSDMLPVYSSDGRQFFLFNLGNDVQFSQNYGFVFLSKKPYSTARYSLSKKQPDEDDNEIIDTNATVTVQTFDQRTVTASVGSANRILLSTENRERSYVNYISFDGSQLRQGRYEITVTLPDSSVMKSTFSARWLDMPLSLYDLDIATEPLQYITTKNEYSDLRRGGRETRIKKFDEFWKKKDSTPQTAYNEVMHEFYRRVDFAMTAFRPLREMNGAVTDRGRIYILYGKPNSTERLLNPDGAPKEIWKYTSLNKIFTFLDPGKQGNYKLAENK